MRRLLPAVITPAIILIFILIPGAIEGLFIDLLRMGRKHMLNAIGLIAF